MQLPEEFEWDEGNKEKNWRKHRVTIQECEEVFFQRPIRITDDPMHSMKERRYVTLGKSKLGRQLIIIFTIRKNRIRVISGRDQDSKERSEYAKEIKKN
jgi:uncharacterized DUF497 family protein